MAILRKIEGNYTLLSREMLRDKNISLEAKGLLGVMLSMADGWNFSIEGMVEMTGTTTYKIKGLFKELKENGYLEIIKEHIDGKYEYVYNIYSEKKESQLKQETFKVEENATVQEVEFQEVEFQEVEFQEVEFQEVEFQEVENQLYKNKQERISNNSFKRKNTKKEKSPADSFDEVWSLYPRHEGKDKARKAFLKAIKDGVDKSTILEGIEAYKRFIEVSGTEERFIKHMSTWINGKCWEDEYKLTTTSQKKPAKQFESMQDQEEVTFDFEEEMRKMMEGNG